MKKLMIACAVAGVLASAWAAGAESTFEFPVSENMRGHENIEWSMSYAFGLTDKTRNLPRVLLVGDSICSGYKDGVKAALEGKMNVTYWISSYCVTSPGYLKLLEFYLDEAKYDVVHFNNGLHSLSTDPKEWDTFFRAALKLIRKKQPQARLVVVTSTPLAQEGLDKKVPVLNDLAKKAAADLGNAEIDDLHALMAPLDRKTEWRDAFHFKRPAIERQVKQVTDVCLKALGKKEAR